MAVFDRVRIKANENLYPVLLGNGNRIEWGLTEGQQALRHVGGSLPQAELPLLYRGPCEGCARPLQEEERGGVPAGRRRRRERVIER